MFLDDGQSLKSNVIYLYQVWGSDYPLNIYKLLYKLYIWIISTFIFTRVSIQQFLILNSAKIKIKSDRIQPHEKPGFWSNVSTNQPRYYMSKKFI